jgi:hypothetical protein
VLCLLIKVVLVLPGVALGYVSKKAGMDTLITMIFSAAIPSMYLACILYSGLELWVYAKLTGEELDISKYEDANASDSTDIESGTQMITS